MNGRQLIRHSVCDDARNATNRVSLEHVEQAETKPIAYHIAKTSAGRGQSAGGMQTRNVLQQPLNVK